MNIRIAKVHIVFAMLILFFTSLSQAQNLDSGLVVRYLFDGNANDASGNGYHGTVGSAIVAVNDRNNIMGGAYNFDGTANSYITQAGPFDLSSMSAVSLSFWVKPGMHVDYPDNRVIFQLLDGTTAESHVYDFFYNYGSQAFLVGNWNESFSNIYSYTDNAFNPEQWHHIVLTFNHITNQTKLYVNNTLELSINKVLIIPGPSTLHIGQHAIYDWNFNGAIDEFNLYNRALTRAEIDELSGHMITGIDNAATDAISMKVYPNPATDYLSVEANGNILEHALVELYDLAGKNTSAQELAPTHTGMRILNVTDLNPGVYFLKVYSGDRTFVKKFVKQ